MIATTASLPRRRLPRWSWFAIIPAALIIVILLILLFMPVEHDPVLAEKDWGAGAVSIEQAWTGLKRDWPDTGAPEFDPALAKLGYELFFDPVLSGDNTRSCASCHNPDHAFSDPRALAARPDGSDGHRHAPTLWNVAYQKLFFWDGRATSLEEQARIAVTSDMELDQDAGSLAEELAAIPEYASQFDDVFADGITADNIYAALAAFERTLISDGSAFDRFADGDIEALTAQQRRGLTVFRSSATRCFECHVAPTFTDGSITIDGVPDNGLNDTGRGAIEAGPNFAFKVPTLRNAALRGPYFHNGSKQTLEEVIAFYSTEAPAFDLAPVDRRINGFSLSDQQQADLVAFLFALSDETIPEQYWAAGYVDDEGHVLIPASVPSGLAVIEPMDNPAREKLAELSAAPADRPDCQKFAGSTALTVSAGESIQAALDCATAGTVVLVEPGIYHEQLVIDQSGITLRGKVEAPSACPLKGADNRFPSGDDAPDWPILDGDSDGDGVFDLTDGVIASGNDFTMEYFIVQHYSGNGVLVEGVNNVTLRHIFTNDSGLYGLYPVRSNNVLIECSVATKIHDAGLYVGQSRDIVVRNSLAYDNVAGIEIENSFNAEVYDNEAWGNTGGLLVFALPNLASHISMGHDVHDNYVHDNNRPKVDARPGSVVALVPVGTGLFVMATDDSEFHNNRMENNDSFGFALSSLYQAYTKAEIGDTAGPLSERNRVYANTYKGNGTKPDPSVIEAGLPGADILWDTSGSGNTFDDTSGNMFPPLLPSSGWPEFLQTIISNMWGVVANLL